MKFQLLTDKQIVAWFNNRVIPLADFQLRQYNKLTGRNRDLARFGISRYIYACEQVGCSVDYNAIREIIIDAGNGISIALENHQDKISKKKGLRLFRRLIKK